MVLFAPVDCSLCRQWLEQADKVWGLYLLRLRANSTHPSRANFDLKTSSPPPSSWQKTHSDQTRQGLLKLLLLLNRMTGGWHQKNGLISNFGIITDLQSLDEIQNYFKILYFILAFWEGIQNLIFYEIKFSAHYTLMAWWCFWLHLFRLHQVLYIK